MTLILISLFSQVAFGQTLDELDAVLGIEEEKTEDVYEKKPKETEKNSAENQNKVEGEIVPKNLGNLGRLAPFQDIAVIQRRYLPKTGRFELFPSLGLVANNAFYWNVILGLRFGYYFTESFGLEANIAFISSSSRKVTDDLESNLSVEISEIVIPKGYYGLDFKWSPVYGKMGLSETTIVPFDMYFLAGGGVTQTNQDTSPFTGHIGTGQIFALSKVAAFRWDLGWYFYSTETREGTISGSFTDMYLSLGVSFFFPEAKYR